MTHTIDVLPESLENEKSIWEYYNEMAAVEDNIPLRKVHVVNFTKAKTPQETPQVVVIKLW